MKKLSKCFKFYGIYFLLEIFLAFILSLLNIFGVNSSLCLVVNLICNILLFYFCGFILGKCTNRRGIIQGLITGSIMILILLITGIIFNISSFSFATIFYYLSLIIITVMGSTVGKNKKSKSSLK